MAPEIVKKLTKKNLLVVVEKGAGLASAFSDRDYEEAGAKVVERSEVVKSTAVFCIHAPSPETLQQMKEKTILVGALAPHDNSDFLSLCAKQGLSAIALEMIPRTSRAQAMDILSSQANIAGYRAVLEATTHYRRFFPLMMTSAGAAKPARVLVLGAGVAGLQAIATAKRLGAQVEAFDIRPEVREQIESLGAKFLVLEFKVEGSGAGGYAKELSAEERARQQAALQEAMAKFDIVIATAAVPGRKAPTLITRDALKKMREGSVIVDLAASSGGNCEATKPGETVVESGVTVVGPLNMAAEVATDASRFFATNIFHLLSLMISDKGFTLPLEDDIIEASLVTHAGEIRFGKPKATSGETRQ